MVVYGGALEGHCRVRAADLAQSDRRGDPDVLEIVVFQYVNERGHGPRVTQPAERVGSLLATTDTEALELVTHQCDLIGRGGGLAAGTTWYAPAHPSAETDARPSAESTPHPSAETTPSEREVHERGGHQAETEDRGWLRDHKGPRADPQWSPPWAGDESAPHHRRTLHLDLPLKGPARALDLDGPIDGSTTPLDLDLSLDRSATRSRDRRVPLHGLTMDHSAWIRQAASNKHQREYIPTILHGQSPSCEPTTRKSRPSFHR